MKIRNKRVNTAPVTTTTGIKFTMSTPSVDRVGDRVMPSWNLEQFKSNPIALFAHSHESIIGKWVDISIIGTELVGTLQLAKKGTSALVDEVTSLIEQGILKAVSIGFSSGKAVENDFGGYDLHDNILMECSVVAVPANYEAVRKSLSKLLPSSEIDALCSVNGCQASMPQEDNTSVIAKTSTQTKTIKGSIMTIAERIKALQDAMTAKHAQLSTLNGQADLSNEDVATMAALSNELAQDGDRLKSFEAMEKAVVPANVVKATPAAATFSKDEAKDAVLKSIVALTKAGIDGKSPTAMAKSVYGSNKAVDMFVKAAVNEGTTTDAEFAKPLIQDGYSGYLEDLMATTVFGKVPAQTITFGKFGSVQVPFRKGTGSLAGAFIEEGAPIPVAADAYNTIKISPYKLGIISVFSKELFRKSIPNIEQLVRAHIQTDTADVIDTNFLDGTAGTALRPAGVEASAGAANIKASVGSTVADIITDFNGIFDRLSASRLGSGGVILINPSRLRGLKMKQDALGNFPFRNTDILTGFNFVESINVPADKLYVIDEKALIKGIGFGVEFEANSSATIVMGDPAEPISSGTAVTALPVRSLYQTDSTALRMTMEISWLQARPNGIQILTGVAY